MKNLVSAIFLLLIFFPACRKYPSSLDRGEYLTWIGEKGNGLHTIKTIGEYNISAQYMSPQGMALIRAGSKADKKSWEAALKQEGNMQYYFLTYSLNNSNTDILKYNMQDESDYFARSNYLSFGIDKDAYILCGKDSLPCRIHHYTPHYGISPKADIVFAFDEPDSLHTYDRTLVIEDQLFGLGILRFEFKANDIKNTPSISF